MRGARLLAGFAALVAPAAAEQPLTLSVTPDTGTQFAVQCTKQGEPVIEHAGDAPQTFGFDQGPVDCRVRIVGEGGVEVTANSPTSSIRSSTHGANAVVTFTLP